MSDSRELVVPTNQMTDLNSTFFKESHHIVFGRLSLSPVEHDLFALFLTRLHAEHWEKLINGTDIRCPEYTFNSEVLSKWFRIKKNDLCTSLKLPCRRLSSQKVGIEDDKKSSFLYMPLFKKVEFTDGLLTLVPNDHLLKEYLCVSQGHSQISHIIFRQLRKESSKRIYGLLCRFQTKGTLHTLPLLKLQSILGLLDENDGIKKKTYLKTGNIIRFLIKPAIQEIAAKEPRITFHKEGDTKSDYYGFSLQKKGPKIIGVKFHFEWTSELISEQLESHLSPPPLDLEASEQAFLLAEQTAHKIIKCNDESDLDFTKEELLNVMTFTHELTKKVDLPDNFWKRCTSYLSISLS